MEHCKLFFFAQVFLDFFVVVAANFDPFTDSNLFSIKWQGHIELTKEEVASLGDRHVMVTTSEKEFYRCILPDEKKQSNDEANNDTGPTVDELIRPLFKQAHCSYRIESYWTYELCHGKHLKQYHETKEQGMPKVQEYYLGFGNHRDNLKDEDKVLPAQASIPVREVDGVELPFYEVIMGDGTKCDLTGAPRKAHVLYVCQPEGRGEVYEFKESSTCEYEVIVLTSLLCKHPKYRPKTHPVNEIRCHAMFGSPLKPSELTQIEHESSYLQTSEQDYFNQEPVEQRKPKFIHKKKQSENPVEPKVPQDQQSQLGALTDKQTLRDILSGSQCLRGGAGWWKHEVCFGKFAKQFHLEVGREANIFLGHWNKEKHLAWLEQNPLKRPKPVEHRKLISLFYSDGDVCDLTKKPRNCEVRLKCIQNIKNPHAVILSLAEPEACQYVLTVESALFCSILKEADDNGLLDHVEL
ncbi:endoplasmic reticulum lectin 1-like isoform X2 [Physella acuta]|uniref:endoplasmic reticulum lectin 1-like isoform X2 n=1 Tax=Physella acuta TaxID=109671 RepID=UPI0027DAB94B|nr:endoplasmic reticulum lectin 1-like isoform X2 [Physella acuta]